MVNRSWKIKQKIKEAQHACARQFYYVFKFWNQQCMMWNTVMLNYINPITRKYYPSTWDRLQAKYCILDGIRKKEKKFRYENDSTWCRIKKTLYMILFSRKSIRDPGLDIFFKIKVCIALKRTILNLLK